MKRSDMIKLMVKIVLDEEYTSDFCSHFADLILNAQEEAGMLPPPRLIDPDKPDYGYNIAFACEGPTKEMFEDGIKRIKGWKESRTWEIEENS